MNASLPLRLLCIAASLAPLTAAFAAEHAISGRVIDSQGMGVPEAVVFVQEPMAAQLAASRPTATMDQFNKTFVPGVLPVVAGTEVRFPNRDQIRHHVYSFSRPKRFELPLYKGEEAAPVVFDQPGVVTIGCNIHDWMSAIILVLPSPRYAVTDAEGRFTLTALEPGSHTLAAWHARSRQKTESTLQMVDAANAGELTFTLPLAPARPRPATRGARWDP